MKGIEKDMKVKKVFVVNGGAVNDRGDRYEFVFDNRNDALAMAWGLLKLTGRLSSVAEFPIRDE